MENLVTSGEAASSTSDGVWWPEPANLAVLDAVDALIVVLDESSRVVYWNRACHELLGCSASDALGKCFWELPGQTIHAPSQRTQQRRPGEGCRRFRQRWHTRPDDPQDVEWSAAPIPAGLTPLPYLLLTGRMFTTEPISATRSLELPKQPPQAPPPELTVLRNRLLADAGLALNASLDVPSILAAMTKLVTRELADCCAIDVRETDGCRMHLAVDNRAEDRREPGTLVARALVDARRTHVTSGVMRSRRSVLIADVREGYVCSSTWTEQERRAFATLAPQSIMLVPMVARGKLVGTMTLLRCRTGRRYDSTLLRLAEELACRVALCVDNARLYQRARRAAQARDDVLSLVAHDLRTPLNVVALAAKRLAEHEGAGRYVDMIGRQVQRMDRLIRDLLDITSIEAGRLSTRLQPQRPAQLLNEAADLARTSTATAGIEITLDVPDETELPRVMADRGRVLQLLSNLIDNAVKFTPSGGKLVLSARCLSAEVLFGIQDTGCGIEPRHLRQIFDRFWQRDPCDRRGSGLGLAISKGIVTAHGGNIWVESEMQVGTRVYFTLPLAPSE